MQEDKILKMKVDPPKDTPVKELKDFYRLVYTLAENKGYKVTPSNQTTEYLKALSIEEKNEK